MNETGNHDEPRGAMYITLASYLDGLRSEQGQLPPSQRKEVPTFRALAKDVDMHEVTLTNIANGNIKLLNLESARKILDALWRRGFQPKESDFIKYVPPGTNEP